MLLEKYGYLILFIGETITIIGYLIRFLFFLIFPEAYQNFVKRHHGITEEEAEELIKYLDQLHTNNTDHSNNEKTDTEENAKGNPLILLAFLIKKREQARGIEPPSQAWEACILPMNYACKFYPAAIIALS